MIKLTFSTIVPHAVEYALKETGLWYHEVDNLHRMEDHLLVGWTTQYALVFSTDEYIHEIREWSSNAYAAGFIASPCIENTI